MLGEIKERIPKGQRILITTLTKRMAEDLTDFLQDNGIKVRYLHSDIDTVERVEIIRDLRAGVFDVLIGINLLREGLDIPEVALIAILDADKEGFLQGVDIDKTSKEYTVTLNTAGKLTLKNGTKDTTHYKNCLLYTSPSPRD